MTLTLPMTFEEFLGWEGEHQFVEWVEGDAQVRMCADVVHQRTLGFLIGLLSLYVERHQLGEILFVPFVMRLPLRPSGRVPDLMYIANNNLSLLRYNYLDGAADLAVEIVSDESTKRDYVDKKAEYAQNGVREYWCIDPDRQTVLFCQLTNEGTYREVMLSEGRNDSTAIEGFWLQVEWLWQEPLPLQEAMTELRLFNLPNANN